MSKDYVSMSFIRIERSMSDKILTTGPKVDRQTVLNPIGENPLEWTSVINAHSGLEQHEEVPSVSGLFLDWPTDVNSNIGVPQFDNIQVISFRIIYLTLNSCRPNWRISCPCLHFCSIMSKSASQSPPSRQSMCTPSCTLIRRATIYPAFMMNLHIVSCAILVTCRSGADADAVSSHHIFMART
jgi:hypothetical protein